MATFEAQVEALTSLSIDGSSAPTQTELTQFLTDGAKEVLNALPSSKKILFTTSNDLNSSSVNLTLGGSEIYGVTRDDGTINQPCRLIPHQLSGRARDSGDMIAATATDPVYYVSNNILSVIPEPSNSNNAHVHTIAYPSVAYGDSSITKFPDDAEYLVPLYGAVKSLQNVLANMNTVTAIDTTALGAITTELNKADDIINTAEGKINDFYTSIGDIDDTTELWDNTNKRFTVVRDALTYAANLIDGNKPNAEYDVAQNLLDVNAAFDGIQAHLADGEAILTNDPSSGDIATAITAMKNAIETAEGVFDKMEGADESVFGDEDTFTTTNSQLTRVKDALDKVSQLIESNKPASGYDAHDLLQAEDVELLQGNLSIVNTELKRAQMHLSEWTAIGDMRIKQINSSLSEAQAYGSEIQARLSYANAYQQASAARGQEGQNRIAQAKVTLSVAQQELARANVAIAEINTIMGSYRLELDGVSPYLQSATGYISQAQGYVAEVNARMQREEQKYKWHQSQQAKLQADYDKGLQIIMGANS